MNDAGTPDPGERDASNRRSGLGRVAWFQVSADPVPGRPLPVQPFLTCAGDVVARIGTLRLQALQILLPGRTIAPSLLLQDAEWFADSDPEARTRVRVTVDGGHDPAIFIIHGSWVQVPPALPRRPAALHEPVVASSDRESR
ncbi:hypothetical protein ACIBQ1_03460 [Nonomuraea sp. NPDC050153]|uniref:hypothetical protein n=1 Tax=Nonomuraea sp. NPDC050153 TaxID=3364359 RepID=UPI003798E5C9